MHRFSLTTRYSRALLRVSIAIIVFVLGHDVMMAMDPAEHDSSISHHEIALEQCGPEDGVVHGISVLPFHQYADSAPSSESFSWMVSHHESGASDAFALDTSKLRAFLQVYLN